MPEELLLASLSRSLSGALCFLLSAFSKKGKGEGFCFSNQRFLLATVCTPSPDKPPGFRYTRSISPLEAPFGVPFNRRHEADALGKLPVTPGT